MVTNTLSRRTFIALTGAAAAEVALHAVPAVPVAARSGVQSLAGEWSFALDRDDAGEKAQWYTQDLAQQTKIALPGILQTQGYGDDITAETQFVAALPRDMRWYLLPQYAEYTKPGHVEVPYLSQPVKHYLGVAWYQREIEIPAAWKGKRAGLLLERTRWQTMVYVDDKPMGECHSLVAPHEFDLGLLAPGKHRLTVRIDNRMILPYRPDGHSVSDGEGGTWNGIVGRIELAATTPVWIDDAQAFPDLAAKSVRIKVKIGNLTNADGTGTLTVAGASAPISWTASGGEGEITVPMPHAIPWSEFTPVLQHLTLQLKGTGADDHREVTFGMREIKADGKNILLNGELFNFRATHDGGGFPLTGFPATDVATWKKIIGVCKEWGLNGIRFHSWCPPEAAFTAGDELGFYFAPECGMWNSFDTELKMLAVLNDETARLLKAYGNHPSLILLNASNEPAGHYAEQLPTWDKKWREADPRRLYSDGTGRWAPPPGGPGTAFAADYLVTGGARGPHGWFGADYQGTLDQILSGSFGRPPGSQRGGAAKPGVPTPCIGHEVGQWCAYPDFDVIAKFSEPAGRVNFPGGTRSGRTPYMVPGNYRIWRDSAETHGLLANNKAIAHASGRFQVACYKEEIEANLRTPGYSGIEMLDLHDYLGQGGALMGLVDAFWEPKSYVAPAEFREYSNTTVPLARLKERVFTTADTLSVPVEVAHYGPAALKSAASRWRIETTAGKTVVQGSFAAREIPRGKSIALGTVSTTLAKLHAPAQYRLVVELDGAAKATHTNRWNFWLYPTAVDAAVPADITITSDWAEAEAKLGAGGKVLYVPKAAGLGDPDPKMSTVPIFWNHLMNPNGTTFLGLWNDTSHRALAGFPTEANCDWQWIDLIANARAMNIDTLPRTLEPIVQPIDDWNRNLRLAAIFECRAGSGRLMACSLDLDGQGKGVGSLRKSLLDYMASAAFMPKAEISLADLHNQWAADEAPRQKQQRAPDSPDLVDPGQIRRKPGV
jgi:beta-galactosidase